MSFILGQNSGQINYKKMDYFSVALPVQIITTYLYSIKENDGYLIPSTKNPFNGENIRNASKENKKEWLRPENSE